jgi:hypothetical protein
MGEQMSGREQRLALAAAQGASPSDLLLVKIELFLFPKSRRAYQDFEMVSKILRNSLESGDETISINVSRKGVRSRSRFLPWVLVGLFAIIVVEYSTYTFPTLVQIMQEFAHKCGL